VKFNFKKIASVLSSVVMVGSTVALAAAANFPAPFVQNGAGDVAIVYGTNGAATDLVAVADIQNALTEELARETATAGTAAGATASGGDSYKLEKTSTKFQLGKGIVDVVSSSVTDDNLPTLLADGVYVDNDNDEFDFTQKITLTNQSLALFEDNDYVADQPSLGMRIASGAQVLNYTLDFTSNPLWADLETTDLTLMGKTYYVLSASATVGSSLTLLDTASTADISEGETKSLTVGAKKYDVKINFIGDNKVKLDVNGEITNQLTTTTNTFKLKDGTYVGIKEINYNAKDTGISNVEFSLGMGKLVLEDGQDVELNDDSISGLTVDLTNSTATDIESIKIIWNAEDDLFVTNDTSAVMPGFGAVKLSSGGMSYASNEAIAVEPDGDDGFVLKNFPLKDSTEDINLLYWNTTHFTYVGEDSTKQLRTAAITSVVFDADTDAQFVVSWTDGSDAESYLMRATSFTVDNSVNKTTIQYRKDGSWVDAKKDAEETDIVSVGNVDLTVGAIDKVGKSVNLSDTGATFNTLYSKDGLKVYLPYANATKQRVSTTTQYATDALACAALTSNLGELKTGVIEYNYTTTSNFTNTSCATSFALKLSEEDKNGNKASGENITLTLADNTNDDTSVTAVSLTKGGSATEIGNSDVYLNYVYSALATEVRQDKGPDQEKIALVYHGDESFGNFFLTAPTTTVAVAASATSGTVKSLGSVIYKDTESVSGKNLIVVGGSCVNSVAATLLGSAKPLCGADFTAKTTVASGQWLIQTYSQTGGKVATLVAGFNAADTTNAATYFTKQPVDITAGKKYVGTSSTVATASTVSS
jgi:hypothetical protein